MTGYRSVENILEEWMKNQDDEEARKRDREILEEHEMRKKKEAEDPNREKDSLGRAVERGLDGRLLKIYHDEVLKASKPS